MKAFTSTCLLAALLIASAHEAQAATHLVQIRDYYFTPTNLHITLGDTVIWTNTAGITHDATSTQGLWASANIQPHATYSRAFTNEGTFPYICQQHIFMHPEQTGQVLVAAATLPPLITITNPINNARFLAPANLSVTAAVTNTVTATNVQIFQNGALAADLPFPPFQTFVSDLPAGNYVFAARAQLDSGLVSTSAPVTIHVLGPAQISAPIRSGNTFRFAVNSISGQTYIAEFTMNFATWLAFATNTASGLVLNFTNSGATDAPRFYRVRQDLD